MRTNPSDLAPTSGDRRTIAGLAVAAVVVLALVVTGFVVRVDYSSLGPGPTRNMLAQIKAPGATIYPSAGELLLTTVSVQDGPMSVIDLIRAWSAREQVIPESFIRQPCTTDAEEIARNVRDIEQSKLEAQLAAFDFLKLKAERLNSARVLAVIPGTPADGKVKAGDVFLSVDGHATPTLDDVVNRLHARRIGAAVRVTVRRAGAVVLLRLDTVASGVASPECGEPYPVIGVSLGNDYRFPFALDIDTADVGGPSGGLVFALALIDSFERADLTGGHVIAATGEIAVDDAGVARVGEIGGITQKVASVVAARADTFLVPKPELAQALAVAPRSLRVIGVDTLREAVDALRGLEPRP